jgi:PAS domain S-box-containing protein
MALSKQLSSTMRIDITPDIEPAVRAPLEESIESIGTGPTCPVVGGAEFRELLAHLYDACIIVAADGRVVSANDRATQFFQYDLHTFFDLTIYNLVSGLSESDFLDIDTGLGNEKFVLLQAFCPRADGSLFPAEIAINKLSLSNEPYFCYFVRDRTLQREQEEQMRTGAIALRNAGSAIGVINTDGSIDYANPAMESLLGDGDHVALNEICFWNHFQNHMQVDGILAKVLAGERWSDDVTLITLGGNAVTARASVAPNFSAEGDEFSGMIISLNDITEQMWAQLELAKRASQMEEDLELAREFQQAFMRRQYPTLPPDTDEANSALRFGHISRPSGAVGGDFFTLVPVSPTKIGIFISDVMGHGVRSALIVATARGLVEELRDVADDPAAFLGAFNRDLSAILKQTGQTAFVTAIYAVIDIEAATMLSANAGHPRPISLHRGTQAVEKLQLAPGLRGPALGLFDDYQYEVDSLQLAEGDTFVLYTDGLSEAENEEGAPFDSPRIEGVIRDHQDLPLSKMLEEVVEHCKEFCGTADFDDDICMVAVEVAHLL